MRKLIVLIIILFVSTSCNKVYNHYDVVNNTSKDIEVGILTHEKKIRYLIPSGEREFVFEHPQIEGDEKSKGNFSNYIKNIYIVTTDSNKKIKKEFTTHNFNFSESDGIFGNHYYTWEFVINESDLK